VRRKRLQDVANTLCHMFRGWQLIFGKPALVALGSGHLSIDVLTGQCEFGGKPIEPLNIAMTLSDYLSRELEGNDIPPGAVLSARLGVDLLFSRVPWHDVAGETFHNESGQVKTGDMHRCEMDCRSEIRTDETVYVGELREIQEWPVGWPSA
jgi:hypothetical protein